MAFRAPSFELNSIVMVTYLLSPKILWLSHHAWLFNYFWLPMVPIFSCLHHVFLSSPLHTLVLSLCHFSLIILRHSFIFNLPPSNGDSHKQLLTATILTSELSTHSLLWPTTPFSSFQHHLYHCPWPINTEPMFSISMDSLLSMCSLSQAQACPLFFCVF